MMDSLAKVAIAIMSGSTVGASQLSPAAEQNINSALDKALQLGHDLLAEGESSVNAVSRVISFLEDAPCFNAGKGSVLINSEMVEMDAAIVNGLSGHYAGVTGLRHIRNPIQLAQKLMAEKPQILMSREGAEPFAFAHGFDYTEQDYFFTDERYDELLMAKSAQSDMSSGLSGGVSAIAMDCHGNFAAATSSGGVVNRQAGSVSDSAFAGTTILAENGLGALAVSGDGHERIPLACAIQVASMLKSERSGEEQTISSLINSHLCSFPEKVALMVMDEQGNVLEASNGAGYFFATMNNQGSLQIKRERC